ncbi:MAG: hypothetical protein QW521_02010 [Desulfurococcaceae archaeon]
MDSKEKELWKKLLGVKVPSFTEEDKEYTIFLGEKGYECDCPDFIYRKGSHWYRIIEDGKEKEIKACKHIGRYLAEQGYEVWEYTLWGWIKLRK